MSSRAPVRRVLFLSNLWPPAVVGGAELYAHGLAAELTRLGHEVKVVTLGVPGPDVVATVTPWPYRPDSWLSQPRWRRWAYHLGDLGRPGVAAQIRTAIDQFRPDVVHSHTVTGMTMAALTVPGAMGVPHVHMLHDYWLVCTHTNLLRRSGGPCGTVCAATSRVRRLGRPPFADAFIAPSQAVFDWHRRRGLSFAPAPTVVVPLAADVPFRGPRRPSSGPPVFGYLGQLNLNKGISTMATAFERAAIPGARLRLAGTGALSASLEHRDLKGVELLGWLKGSAREAFFASIDCLLVCSEWPEPGATVIAEAKARGLPVIATDIGCLPEIVPVGCRPLLAPPGDADALARSLRAYADEPAAYVVQTSDRPLDASEHAQRVLAVYDLAVTARKERSGRSRSEAEVSMSARAECTR